MILKSSALELHVDDATGAFAAVDLRTQVRWTADPWENNAGQLTLANPDGRQFVFALSNAERVAIRRTGDNAVEVAFQHLRSAPDNGWAAVSVRTRLTLDERGFDVEVLGVTYPDGFRFVQLEYPCRFGALHTDRDQGHLVIPFWQGSLVPSTARNFPEIPRVPFWSWDDMPWRDPGTVNLPVHAWNGISMPFFGLLHGASAWGAILVTEDDAGIRCYLNNNLQNELDARNRQSKWPRVAAVSPLFYATRGEFGYARKVSYRLLESPTYTAVAKHYRNFARTRGLLVSLREKIERTPALGKIIGGPLVNFMGGYPWYIDPPAFRFTWKQAGAVFDDMVANMGIKNALICMWIGYAKFPPNSFPFHPSNGTDAELAEMVARAKQKDFLVCFYHGYPALLDHDPDAPAWNEARQVAPNGAIKSRWGRLCSSQYLKYAKANLPRSIAVSGQVADYSDMITAGPIDECWSPEHGLTRTQDRRNKEEVFQYIKSLGLFTGSENARGWAVPHLGYAKNGSMGGNHAILNAIPIPLFSLVFKDCLILYREHQVTAGPGIYNDVAIGNHPQIHFSHPEYRLVRDELKGPAAVFATVNRDTGLEELIEHRFENEVNGPFVTRFGNGTEIRVNPTLAPRDVQGAQVGPESVLIGLSQGRTFRVTPKPRGFEPPFDSA